MDLMDPMQIEGRGGKRYVLVVVDDFSRYSFVSFLREKSKAIECLKSLFNKIQVDIGHPIIRIRSDGGGGRGESLTMWMLTFFAIMEFNMNFQLLKLLNKIE